MPKQNPVDQLFKEQLEKHELKPSPAAWEKISAATTPAAKKTSPVYVLRAAAVALLIGINAVFYFSSNTKSFLEVAPTEQGLSLSTTHSGQESGKKQPGVVKQNKLVKGVEVKPEGKAKPSSAARNSKPVLKQEKKTALDKRISDHNFTQEAEPKEIQPATQAETPEIKKPVHYAVTITDLPATQGDYEVKEQEPKAKIKDKVLAYAGNQWNRILAGEKPQLPAISKTPQVSITLPKFLNKTEKS
jgi:hypothetical protein